MELKSPAPPRRLQLGTDLSTIACTSPALQHLCSTVDLPTFLLLLLWLWRRTEGNPIELLRTDINSRVVLTIE